MTEPKFTVTYGRTIQPQQYHPVHIGVTIYGYDDDSIDFVFNKAKFFVDEKLRKADEEFGK